ncbi:MAG: zeta toxin family protein [Bacteroidetes bacterium]|nr:zeta toxin family protein [Bacteroidota bacterium]
MPEFLVIAGPNGAGKSSFSRNLSSPGAIIFDPDKEKKIIENNYPDISDEAIQDELTRVYGHFEMRALGKQLDLTVESNLRNEFVAERAKLFKENGYHTSLIFAALPNLKASIDRVQLRVDQKGHFVDAESIRYNYSASLENLKKVAPIFDNFMLLDTSPAFDESPALPSILTIYKNGLEVRRESNSPKWAIPLLTELKAILSPDDPGPQLKQGPKR